MTVQTLTPPSVELQHGEATTSMMFYTANAIVWGDIIHHESILASRILTGVTILEYINIHNAQILMANLNFMGKPIKKKSVYLPSTQINAYHLTPPQEDQLDYDPTEPNRKMSLMEICVPPFSIKAKIRISEVTTVKSNLEALKADFIAFYDAESIHLNNPNMKPIRTNMILVRSKASIFTTN